MQVDARNVDGSTPLCEACSVGSLECVQMLLEHGAMVNPALTSRTTSPLHEACMGGKSRPALPSPHLQSPCHTIQNIPSELAMAAAHFTQRKGAENGCGPLKYWVSE